MNFSLIVCTYMRPKALLSLLKTVESQEVYPLEILIIDGSKNQETEKVCKANNFKNLVYFQVDDEDRGLTKQRNFGINHISKKSEVVCFLDDDTELLPDYFKELIKTFKSNSEITGVGGVSVNENRWQLKEKGKNYSPYKYYVLENYYLKEGLRNVVRNYLGLQSNKLPNIMPEYSNGRASSYPLSGKIYEVDLLIGMSFAFHKKVFSKIQFSNYFEGYGLYEDADYSIRALTFGKNVINTKVKLNHYHNPDGRPNKFKYGKMVIRNGWYVWRIKYPNPSFKSHFKWNAIAFILTGIRYLNVITTSKRKEALTEALGRTYGWWTLLFNKPKIER